MMTLYEANYIKLTRLIPDLARRDGSAVSLGLPGHDDCDLHLTIENLRIPEYRSSLDDQPNGHSFKQAMKDDMERRRDLWATPFPRNGKLHASRT